MSVVETGASRTADRTRPSRRGRWLVLAVVPVVAACGSSIAGQANDVSPTDVDVATSDAMMTQLYMDIAGTPAQRTEQEFLIHSRLQGAIDDCMAEAGFRYSLPAFWDPYAGMTDFGPPEPVPEAASADVARAARVGFGIAQQVEASEYSGEDDTAYLALSAAGRAAYDEALNKCTANSPNAEGIPDFALDLTDQLTSLVVAAAKRSARPDDAVAYGSCMRDAGFPVVDRQEAIDAGWEKFQEFYASPATHADAQSADGSAWDQAAEYERGAAVADAICRSNVHKRLVSELTPAAEKFRLEHADEIAAIQADWNALVVEAASARDAWQQRLTAR